MIEKLLFTTIIDSHAALTHHKGIDKYGVENELGVPRAQLSGMIDVNGAL